MADKKVGRMELLLVEMMARTKVVETAEKMVSLLVELKGNKWGYLRVEYLAE